MKGILIFHQPKQLETFFFPFVNRILLVLQVVVAIFPNSNVLPHANCHECCGHGTLNLSKFKDKHIV